MDVEIHRQPEAGLNRTKPGDPATDPHTSFRADPRYHQDHGKEQSRRGMRDLRSSAMNGLKV